MNERPTTDPGSLMAGEDGRKRGLTRAQLERLRQAIDPSFVEEKNRMKYMAQHEVRAELTRIFGYGNWDTEVVEMTRLWEHKVVEGDSEYPAKPKAGNPPYWRVCYRAGIRLTIRDYWGNVICSFVEYHAEANSVLPDRGEAEAMAITSVESYALRRAAIGLGDRFGLGLYDGGKTDPLVRNSLQFTDTESPRYKAPAGGKGAGTATPDPRLQGAMNVREEVRGDDVLKTAQQYAQDNG